jgi:4,5-DOPA dioxygenase extradiol
MTPTLFLSHGSPSLLLERGRSRDFLAGLGTQIGRPEAIVCISAHWDTSHVTVGLSAQPETIHDFYGFPPEMYQFRYPAPGNPALGVQILDLLSAAGIPATGDAQRGIDHGVWSPLALMYPGAGIPVVEISVQTARSFAHHLAVGKALQALRNQGVLVVGSGSATHNLRELGRETAHAPAFENWLVQMATEGRADDIVKADTLAPQYYRNHPTPEHFLPLFGPLGAAGENARAEAFNRVFDYGSLSMAALLWH